MQRSTTPQQAEDPDLPLLLMLLWLSLLLSSHSEQIQEQTELKVQLQGRYSDQGGNVQALVKDVITLEGIANTFEELQQKAVAFFKHAVWTHKSIRYDLGLSTREDVMAIESDKLHSTLHTLKTFGIEQNEAHVHVFAFCMHATLYHRKRTKMPMKSQLLTLLPLSNAVLNNKL